MVRAGSAVIGFARRAGLLIRAAARKRRTGGAPGSDTGGAARSLYAHASCFRGPPVAPGGHANARRTLRATQDTLLGMSSTHPHRRLPIAAPAAVLAAGLLLAGCSPLGMGLMAATNLITGLAGGGGGGGAEGQSAAPAVSQQLASLDPTVSRRCTAQLERSRPETADANADADADVEAEAEADAERTREAASDTALPRCELRPVCLPGASTPVMMRSCTPAPAAPAQAQSPAVEPAGPPAWDWNVAASAPADTPQPF